MKRSWKLRVVAVLAILCTIFLLANFILMNTKSNSVETENFPTKISRVPADTVPRSSRYQLGLPAQSQTRDASQTMGEIGSIALANNKELPPLPRQSGKSEDVTQPTGDMVPTVPIDLVSEPKRAPPPRQADSSTLPCGGGTNRARSRRCDCPGKDDTRICLTFTGDCDSPMTVDCEHMRKRVNGGDSAAAVVVTAFWNLRPDIRMEDWKSWLSQVHDLNAELVSFVPASFASELRQRRASGGQQHRTCVIEMETTQLPYGYLLPDVEAMLQRLVDSKPNEYGNWNWASPEMANSHFVLLQAGKFAVLDAVRELGFSRGRPLVWVDAGLGRHAGVDLSGVQVWPARAQLAQLDPARVYIGSWPGHGPMAQAVAAFCAAPEAEFLRNRNQLSGTVLIASEAALEAVFPVWTYTLERMVNTTRWNSEQVAWELLMCFYPEAFGVLDYRRVLFQELKEDFGPLSTLHLPLRAGAGEQAYCRHWDQAGKRGGSLGKKSNSIPPVLLPGIPPVLLPDPEYRNRGCINADYKHTSDFAVMTFVTLDFDKGYLRGALTLGKSVRRHSTVPLDMLVMQLEGPKELDAQTQAALRKVGYQMCTVKRIVPKNEKDTWPRFRDQFTKLQLWGMTQYKGILFMDADNLVVGKIEDLFTDKYLGVMRARGAGVTAARDIMGGQILDSFNMGVFLVVPNATEYRRLLAVQKSNVKFATVHAEQAFLNVVYRDRHYWHELPFKYNANLAAYREMRSYWDKERPDMRVVHYTLTKGWACQRDSIGFHGKPDADLYPVCEWWHKEEQSPPLAGAIQAPAADTSSRGSSLSVRSAMLAPAPKPAGVAVDGNQLCINADYKHTSDFAVMTFVTLELDKGYLRGALTLGKSVRQHATVPLDLVVMQLQGPKELDAQTMATLRAAGFQVCTVKRIAPKNEGATYPRFRDQFTKLQLWGMTQYKGILFMDADNLVVGNIDELFTDKYLGAMRAEGAGVTAARDIWKGKIMDEFNMGVFLIVPNAEEHRRLLALQNSGIQFRTIAAEQGFLDVVYRQGEKKQWHELPFKYNANLAAYEQMRPYWDREVADIRIIHYTLTKGWACSPDNPLYSVCEWWHKAERSPVVPHAGAIQAPAADTRPELVDVAVNRKSMCINDDYTPTHDFAVMTLVTLQHDKGYLQGALTLGKSVRQHSTVDLDLVIIQLSGPKKLDAQTLATLRAAGFQVCTVERIAPMNLAATDPLFVDQFTKLQLWGMTQYKGILYLDTDTLVRGNIDELFTDKYLGAMRAQGSGVTAARDIMYGRQMDSFNMGVFLIVPNAEEHRRLLALQKSNVKFNFKFAEQGFLNVVYKDKKQWHELPFKYNANVAAFSTMRSFWNKEEAEIRIVHFTDTPKPWRCPSNSHLYSVCEWWIKAGGS